ncbi:hypothetical protein PUNSTDRAFT_144649 [Punctularia strigosozonata HHB-11173 SS5]|uniref:uncharacterized protein n=1 Tax=Punctularia strigosozonata (strain HHB-11173) TaxID=741275 RepID=UPI00044184A2|nr:uncharacterized protein PUNSTDRAFT_144649 [Punctularia strigosozonata HHB-11173 SS5]EIN07091.1 hypothetical protein PUNSTDRAFT_144649 [Punctularia strigosozonata HHB-11173 SS5]
MASAAARSPNSSTFPALLKRTKFVTYDPAIAQVYTSPSGDAHRGNWGLKRPLALKRRRAFITVKTVDTLEKQTDWDPANQEALFMKKWAEVGKVDNLQPYTPWAEQLGVTGLNRWNIDSEFALGTNDGSAWINAAKGQRKARTRVSSLQPQSTGTSADPSQVREAPTSVDPPQVQGLIPNPEAMKPKEFEAYLDDIREMRPEFLEFLKQEAAKSEAEERKHLSQEALNAQSSSRNGASRRRIGVSDDPLTQYAQNSSIYRTFLRERAMNHALDPHSRRLERQPHPDAGLIYIKLPRLQHYFMTKPQPGRVLQGTSLVRDAQAYITSFAGMTPLLNRRAHGDQTNVDFGTDKTPRYDSQAGILRMRLRKAQLLRAPEVVGRHTTGLSGARITGEVEPVGQMDAYRPVTWVPGSRDYVGALTPLDGPVAPMRSGLVPAPKSRSGQGAANYLVKNSMQGEQLLNRIKGLLSNMKTDEVSEGDDF